MWSLVGVEVLLLIPALLSVCDPRSVARTVPIAIFAGSFHDAPGRAEGAVETGPYQISSCVETGLSLHA